MFRALWLVWALLVGLAWPGWTQETLRARYAGLREVRDQSCRELVAQLENAGDLAAAAAVRARSEPRDPGREYFFVPASFPEPETIPQLNEIQRAYAAQLFELASEAVEQQSEAAAFAWLHEVCACDTNHADARRILGFRLRDNAWQQTAAVPEVRRARAKHPKLPWPAGSFQWIETANYEIASTADSDVTLQFAERLERWRTVWLQAYFEFWAPKMAIARRLSAGSLNTRARGNKHQVVLFRDRPQYVETLAALGVTGVERSTGYYSDRQETMFVYDAAEPDLETWLQEQCHQLCQEVGSAKTDPVENSHIWVVEGLGMYFESLVEYADRPYVSLGGWDARRLQFARIRWQREGYWLPLSELTGLSQVGFQTHPQVAVLYSQTAGLTHFLMLADDSKYRSSLLQLAKLVYAKRAKTTTLAELTSVADESLTRECQQWLPAKNDQVRSFLTLPEQRTELALGFGDVDSRAGAAIERCVQLQWLQLSHSQVDDAIGPSLAKLMNLRQLFLDDTAVGDASLANLAGLRQLEELDLAGTQITDDGLRHLESLSNLKVLWLGQTKISDAGLQRLLGMKSLELLDVGRTKVSREGLQRLKTELPGLKLVEGESK